MHTAHALPYWGGLPDRDPLDRDPLDRDLPLDIDPPDREPLDWDPPGQRPPWTETFPWTETPQTETPNRDPLDIDPWTEIPQTETPRQRPPGQRPLDRDLLVIWPVVHAGTDHPLWTEWLTDRCKNITLPQLGKNQNHRIMYCIRQSCSVPVVRRTDSLWVSSHHDVRRRPGIPGHTGREGVLQEL